LGIIAALVMRAAFIAVGVSLIQRFHWILYIFGVFLIVTGIRMALQEDQEFDAEKNLALRISRRIIP